MKTARDNQMKWQLKLLPAAVFASLGVICVVGQSAQATDLEIYAAPEKGTATIMMMLDTSGSMDPTSIEEDYPNKGFELYRRNINFPFDCFGDTSTRPKNPVRTDRIVQPIFNDEGGVTSESITYTVDYCVQRNVKYYDRISRLKMALIPLFANPKANFGQDKDGNDIDFTKFKIGLGDFFYEPYDRYHPGQGGRIKQPALSLTLPNRKQLLQKIVTMQADSYTPIAAAYAEAGAYMLGTRTSSDAAGNGRDSGFYFSADSTKNSSRTFYQSPIVDRLPNQEQCDGYGVYFLTDGEPNQSDYRTASTLMNNSLQGSTLRVGQGRYDCYSNLGAYGAKFGEASTWECIGDYALKLRNESNPKRTKIKTAAVGFGKTFEQLETLGRVDRTIVDESGKPKTYQVYQCNRASSTDVKNLCRLGERGDGFGEGGFYYTNSPQEIANSIVDFANGILIDTIVPISTGNIAAPLDVLSGGRQSRKFAYLPILDPKPGQTALWQGNLKKYKVNNATLKGGNDRLAFMNAKGQFATNTYDLWNTIEDTARQNPDIEDSIPDDALRPDKGKPLVGGAYQKIFENAVSGSGIGTRNVFVNSSGSLKGLSVVSNKPVNFDALSAGYDQAKKRALLTFMGYNEPAKNAAGQDILISDTTTLTAPQNKWLKNHGGVLHSLPQLITTEVELNAAGRLLPETRKDYLLYGSMDGALHLVDDATGKEKFSFVPKQILDLQPDALKGVGTTKSGKKPYGIDAPWLVTPSYQTKSAGTGATKKITYELDQAFAAGGMRMGGSMYYALDLSNISSPRLIYSVGSNYANRLEGETTALQGIKNDVISATGAEQQAFSKMGQTWGKPTAAYVKSGGKRVMVNILPGGYDECYEDPKFKLGSNVTTNTIAGCNGVTNAQGSALYMVQVGEEKKRSGSEKTYFDATTNNGKLLWWADDAGAGSDATSRSSSLQYSRNSDLKHSIVAQVRAIDRNYDGLTDIIYFADLGGQLFRADINNNNDTDNFKVDRVVKLLDVSDQVSGTDTPPRIYERPFVTYYNGSYGFVDSANATGTYEGVTTLVTVGTGDRSNPVTAIRSKPDAVYSIFDKDMARRDLFDYTDTRTTTLPLRSPTIKVSAAGSNKLIKLTDGTGAITADVKSAIIDNSAQGWYLPLTSWMGTEKTSGPYKIKMFNEPDALSGIMILSSYDPDASSPTASCSASVVGETQRERICLPYGTCSGGETTRKFVGAGGGIADNVVTQYNDTSLFGGLGNQEKTADDVQVVCTTDDCPEIKIDDSCDGTAANPCPVFDPCVGDACGPDIFSNTGKNINPLSWLER